jgi:hypothetical protein
MWSNPRSEIISVDTDRLARHAFAQMGFTCVYAVPAENSTRLTALSATEWWQRHQSDGLDTWFRNQREAGKILGTMVTLEGTFWAASRCDTGDVLVEASIDRIDAVIDECLKWHRGIRLVTSEEIDARTASVRVELDRALVQMQSTGHMQLLNRQYKALRTGRAEGEKLPSFKNWLTAQLEGHVLKLLAL